MICAEFEEKVALYVGGDLEPAEAARVAEHLRRCPDCAEFADGLQPDRAVLQAAPPEMADADFTAMRRGVRRAFVRQRTFKRVAPVALIAASVLVAVAVRNRHLEAPPMPPQTAVLTTAPPAMQQVNRSAPAKPPVRRRRLQPVQVARLETPPRPDPVLEAALRDFIAAQEAPQPPPVIAPPVEIRLVTNDPSVVLILVPSSSGATNE